PLPRFLGAQVRRQRMLADGPPDEISRRIPYPDNDHGEQQQNRPLGPRAVQPDRKGERKRNENKSAGTNPCRRKCFHQWPPGEERKRCNSENEQKEGPLDRRHPSGKPTSIPVESYPP